MTDENAETKQEKQEPKNGLGCLRLFGRLALVGLLVLAGLLVWVNGPGMRWLGPKVAEHFLEKAGMTGSLSIGGTLLGGVRIYDLDIRSADGSLERLTVDRLETDYRFSEVIKGKVRGISGEGVHLDLRLVEKEKEDKPPVDFAELGKTLGGLREKFLPLELDLADVSFSVKRDGERVVELEGSRFSHGSGADVIALELGRVIDPEGRFTQKQKAKLVWSEEGLTLDRLELLPIAGLRDVSVKLPEDGTVAASADIRLGRGILRLDVGAGIKDVRLDLIEGELDFGKLLEGLGLGLPLKGKLTSLALEMRQVYPDWQKAVGMAEVFVEEFSYDGWAVPEASIGVTLDDGELGAKVAGKSLDSDFSLDGKGEFERSAIVEGKFELGRIAGNLNIDQLGQVLRALGKKLELAVDFTDFPASDIGGKWSVDLGEQGFGGALIDVLMAGKDADATAIHLDAGFNDGVVTVKQLGADGLEFSGTYEVETQTYEAKQVLEKFDSASIEPWLKGAGIALPGSGVVSMKWEGSGILSDNKMKGEFTGLDGTWIMKAPEGGEARPPISAKAEKITYDWPGTAGFSGLVVETQGQKMKLDGALQDNELKLERFLWLEGEEELAKGSGTLPVPEDFSKFAEFIANDTRPLDLQIESETLPLSMLRPWVRGLDQIGDGATGKVDFKVVGSLAEPEVDMVVDLKNISSPSQTDIPKTDVLFNVDAKDGVAKISAQATAPGYAPATMEVTMPFLPKKWAEDPETLKEEKILGKLDLPRLELSLFQSLIPGAKKLGGVATGTVDISGTLGDPKVDGNLKLSDGSLALESENIPGFEGMDFDVSTDLNEVTIKGAVKDLEGGTLRIDGTLGLKNESGEGLGKVDVTITGRGLPVVRNESLITRANADISVKGTMESALVSGEVGIIDSVFFKDIELIPIGKPFLGPSAAKLPAVDTPDNPGEAVPAAFKEWTVNVVVKTLDPILIRGNLGEGQVDVALRIEGKLGNPKPNGFIRLRKTVARLPFTNLEVREGLLTFTPQTGFDPALEIRGNAEPRPYRVQIYAYGRASDPQLVLTSQPPLPENEIMTLLATGTTSSGLEDSQEATSRATQLLIEELRRGRFLFGKQLRPLLGLLDNVDFSIADSDPYDSDSYNSATLKLSERWFLSAGLGSEGDQRFMAIWRLRFK